MPPRSNPRIFDIELAVDGTVSRSEEKFSGRTRHTNSRRVSILSDARLAVGVHVRLSIQWPFLLHGSVSMALKVIGDVIHTDAEGFEVAIRRHEFRYSEERDVFKA
jgi:hypothetical protein